MKDPEGVLIFVLATITACALFWGLIMGVKKSFSIPQPTQNIDFSKTFQQQHQKARDIAQDQEMLIENQRQRVQDLQGMQRQQQDQAQDTLERQKRLMEDQRQRMRDMQRR